MILLQRKISALTKIVRTCQDLFLYITEVCITYYLMARITIQFVFIYTLLYTSA